ncbi:MAG: cytochrome c3 family protein [candidate division Zixibacteria bacterium]|nr:cytochrome c3 family protein [candidate division Zixibacteria bacterium]
MNRLPPFLRYLPTLLGALVILCPPSQTKAAEQKSCYSCHPESKIKFQRKFQHAPVVKEDCEACHMRHGFANVLLLKKGGRELCATCHPGYDSTQLAGTGHLHPAFAEGLCATCHDPHASDRKGLMRVADGDLACFVCHADLKDTTGHPTEHPPFAERDCGVCHADHASTIPGLLKKPSDSLCAACHDAAGIRTKHAVRGLPTYGLACVGCHDPHRSPRPALVSDHVHEPVGQGQCDACHAPAAAGSNRPGPADSTWAGCRTCHDEIGAKLSAAVVHPPAGDGACYVCHSAHQSRHPKLLRGGVAELCQTCHEDMTAAKLAGQQSVHAPVAAGHCQDCHDPHGSNEKNLLKKPGDDLCLSCHGQDKFSHSQHLKTGDLACLDCHVPHASTQPSLLADDPRATCGRCHSPQPKAGMAAHDPYAKGNCSACHDPHGGSGNNLRASIPGLCYQCHQNIARFTTSTVKHPPADSCLACHGAHEAPNDKLLLASGSQTCASCHDMHVDSASGSVHAPYGAGDCTNCHNPHGSAWPGLLGPRRQIVSTPVGEILQYPKLDSTRVSLCRTCHKSQIDAWSAKPIVHQPVKDGHCESCHAPHQATERHLLIASAKTLCQSCHDPAKLPTGGSHQGIDLAATDCTQCHDPHASDKPGLLRPHLHPPFADGECESCHTKAGSAELTEPQPGLCLTCHDDLGDQLHRAVSHPPARDGLCTACHAPHAANEEKLLVAAPPDLCRRCHQAPKEMAHPHPPFMKGECLKCHTPHGSATPALLAQDANTLCLGCHQSLKERLGREEHHAAVDRGCLNCHDGHGSSEPAMLRAPVAQLCGRCHDVKTDRWRAAHAGGGVQAAAGNCMSCHDPHAAPKGTVALLKAVQHAPFAERTCGKCHPPGQAARPRGNRQLCGTCHANTLAAIDRKPFQHAALSDSAECMACHSPHDGDTQALLRQSGFSACLNCHPSISMTQANVHPPAAEDCANCHTPHGGDNAQLLAEPDIMKLCEGCHEGAAATHFHPMGDKAKDPHTGGPLVCTGCHSPHSSPYKALLLGDPSRELCIRCHDTSSPPPEEKQKK